VSHVFTYGSLMFPAVWRRVVSGDYRALAARLPGFRRQRVRGELYPSLEPVAAEEDPLIVGVDGLLYLDVSAADLDALDAFEGVDYRRIETPLLVAEQIPGGPAPGTVLVANAYLFVAPHKVEPGEWDPRHFERESMARFLREYPPPRDG
jgi:hypothetical protein